MKKQLSMLMLGIMCILILSGCDQVHHGNYRVFTEDNMDHFYSEKIPIDEINTINIESSYAKFEIIASDNYYMEYSYYYTTKEPKLSIKDSTFDFSDTDINDGSDSISLKEPNYLKIYVPTTSNFDLISIKKASGNCSIGNFVTDQLSIVNSYGDTIVSNCKADKVDMEIASGKLSIKNSTIEKANLKNAYGDIELDTINDSYSWMDSLKINLSSGNLTLSNVFCNEMDLDNSYGENNITNCAIEEMNGDFESGNVTILDTLATHIKINDSYGHVTMVLLGKESDYKFDVESSYGSVKIGESTYNGNVFIDHDGKKEITLKMSSGNTDITFKEQ